MCCEHLPPQSKLSSLSTQLKLEIAHWSIMYREPIPLFQNHCVYMYLHWTLWKTWLHNKSTHYLFKMGELEILFSNLSSSDSIITLAIQGCLHKPANMFVLLSSNISHFSAREEDFDWCNQSYCKHQSQRYAAASTYQDPAKADKEHCKIVVTCQKLGLYQNQADPQSSRTHR